MISLAQSKDIDAIKYIADRNKAALGFVMRPALIEAQQRSELLVATQDGVVVGFVNYRTLSRIRVGWHTIYEICVDESARGQGMGRALLDAVPRPVRLKCPVDLTANEFYKRYGLLNVWTEQPDNKRTLNIWQTQPDIIYCADGGGNRRIAEIARAAGMLYGTRHDDTPAFKPYMVDINWKRYDWNDYLSKIEAWKPVMAMVPDYETPEHRGRMVRMACQLVERGVERVMVCPKFHGAVEHIPDWCVVAVSVPSKYAGFIPDLRTLAGRRVHLLGSSPQAQMKLAREIAGHGGWVISVDGNNWTAAARWNRVYGHGIWWAPPTASGSGYLYDAYQTSAQNIMRHWQQQNAVQLPLL